LPEPEGGAAASWEARRRGQTEYAVNAIILAPEDRRARLADPRAPGGTLVCWDARLRLASNVKRRIFRRTFLVESKGEERCRNR
jgi:hypothetical protein